jgi:UDP-N-acetylmuramate--alanine ligase
MRPSQSGAIAMPAIPTDLDVVGKRVHFVGVGGIGMSALAQALVRRGAAVSGSDLKESAIMARLRAIGVAVAIGHNARHAESAEALVYSDAVPDDNVERVWAVRHNVPVLSRSELLGWLMRGRRGIAVAGTHGKTTVCAMIGLILQQAGRDPTVLVGGELDAIGGNARIGDGPDLVAEACEAYEGYLDLDPEIAVVTNIEADHLDHHHTEDALHASFRRFLARVKPGGAAVLCWDRPELRVLAPDLEARVVGYSAAPEGQEAPYRGETVALEGTGSRFRLVARGQERDVSLRVPGQHNVANAVGAAAVACELGVALDTVVAALGEYRGVARRFERLGEIGGVAVIDDYAHHPTEIRATLAAARRGCRGRLVAIFQPHLYSRTRDLLAGFAAAFDDADITIITDIYPAREAPIPGVSAEAIVARAKARRPEQDIEFITPKEAIARRLAPRMRAGDLVLTMGAGDVDLVAREILGEHGGDRGVA